jgi:hypothetical protein
LRLVSKALGEGSSEIKYRKRGTTEMVVPPFKF